MKYVKLIAKPGTWFKEGTEVYSYDNYGERITLEEYEEWKESGSILVRGIRICELEYEVNLGYKKREEREDGELCSINEFDVEIIED